MIKDPCKGCICSSCTLSEKSGNVYGCKEKRCKNCTDEKYLRLNYCPSCIPIQEKGEVIRL